MYHLNFFGKMKKEVNFGNIITKILRKQEREERSNVTDVEERKRNFDNDIAKNKIIKLWQLN